MTSSSERLRLLEEALIPGALADSLVVVRRLARRRRVARRAVRTTMLICIMAGAIITFRMLPGDGNFSDRNTTGNRKPIRPFILVTNVPQPDSAVVRTVAAPANLVVTTSSKQAPVSRASGEDLFASAGDRPGGLVQLADGTAHWMWLDAPELE